MARRFMMQKMTGVITSTWMVDVTIPPMIGVTIGFITSELTPVLHMMGIKAAMTTLRRRQ